MNKLKIADRPATVGDITVMYKPLIPRLWSRLLGKSEVDHVYLENFNSELLTINPGKIESYSLKKAYSKKEIELLLKLNTDFENNTTEDILTIINKIRPNTVKADPTKDITQLDDNKYYIKHNLQFTDVTKSYLF